MEVSAIFFNTGDLGEKWQADCDLEQQKRTLFEMTNSIRRFGNYPNPRTRQKLLTKIRFHVLEAGVCNGCVQGCGLLSIRGLSFGANQFTFSKNCTGPFKDEREETMPPFAFKLPIQTLGLLLVSEASDKRQFPRGMKSEAPERSGCKHVRYSPRY
jgi:hypothetical protein